MVKSNLVISLVPYNSSAMHVTFATKVVAKMVLEFQARAIQNIMYFKITIYPALN